MRTRLKLFLEWGITFGQAYEIDEQSARKVAYADRRKVEEEIIRRNAAFEPEQEEAAYEPSPSGGMAHAPIPAINLEPMEQKHRPGR